MTANKYFFALVAALLSNISNADEFKSEFNHSWAATPKGKFECISQKSGKDPDTLTFAGKVFFKGSLMAATSSDGTLASGIYNANTGCPTIVASNAGYVVMARQTQPPSFGINGYVVLDTNANPPELTELAESQSPHDDKISGTKRVQWTKDGLTLSYFGFPVGTQGGSVDSPKSKNRKVFYSFKTGEVTQAK